MSTLWSCVAVPSPDAFGSARCWRPVKQEAKKNSDVLFQLICWTTWLTTWLTTCSACHVVFHISQSVPSRLPSCLSCRRSPPLDFLALHSLSPFSLYLSLSECSYPFSSRSPRPRRLPFTSLPAHPPFARSPSRPLSTAVSRPVSIFANIFFRGPLPKHIPKRFVVNQLNLGVRTLYIGVYR